MRPHSGNAHRVLRAPAAFGFHFRSLKVDDFLNPNKIVRLGVPPVRADLIPSLTGVSWEEADASKEQGRFGDVPVHYIGRQQYIANTRAAGRKKDLADIEALGED